MPMDHRWDYAPAVLPVEDSTDPQVPVPQWTTGRIHPGAEGKDIGPVYVLWVPLGNYAQHCWMDHQQGSLSEGKKCIW